MRWAPNFGIFLLFNIIASLEGVYAICMLLVSNGLSGLGA